MGLRRGTFRTRGGQKSHHGTARRRIFAATLRAAHHCTASLRDILYVTASLGDIDDDHLDLVEAVAQHYLLELV